MVGHTTKATLGEDGPFSHVKKLCLPTSQLTIHIIQNKVKVRSFQGEIEHRGTKVFPKSTVGIHTKNGGEFFPSGQATIF